MIRSAVLFTLVLFASPALAQRTMIVDASGHPDADFESLEDALAAAVDGDLLLMRLGSYGPLVVNGKAVRIEADAGAEVFVDRMEIRSTTAGQAVSIRGVRLARAATIPDHGVLVEDCDGPVWIELLSATSTYESNREGIFVSNSLDVVLSRATVSWQPDDTSLPLVRFEDSSTYVFDSLFLDCYSTAFEVDGGFFGLYDFGSLGCGHGSPGTRIEVHGGAVVEEQRPYGPVTFPSVFVLSGTYSQVPSRARTHTATSPAYEGDDVSVHVQGQAGDAVWVLFGDSTGASRAPRVDTPLFLTPSFQHMPLGVLPASGVIDFDATVGSIGTVGLRSLPIYTQAFFLNPMSKARVLSEPTALTLLDDALADTEYLLPEQPNWTSALPGTTSLGVAVASTGDVNGDGYEDVIVGDPSYSLESLTLAPYYMRGAVAVYHGGPGGLSTEAAWFEEGDTRIRSYGPSAFGSYVGSAGDVNGDGFGDVFVSSAIGGQLFVYYGSEAGVRSLRYSLIEPSSPWGFQGRAAGLGDVNGDGFDDVVMLAECWAPSCEVNGKNRVAWLFHGSASGLDTTAPAFEFTASGTYVASVARAGDVNGDGFADFLVGSVELSSPDEIALLLGGPTTPTLAWSFAAPGLVFPDFLGVGDLDGDGLDDMVFGEGYNMLHVFRGAAPMPASVPDQTLVSPFFTNGEIVALGDVDGDGLADIAVEGNAEAWYMFRGSSGALPQHPVRGLRGSPSWSHRRSDPNHTLQLGGVADLNGDGKSEVFVGEFPWKLGQGTGSVVGFYSLP